MIRICKSRFFFHIKKRLYIYYIRTFLFLKFKWNIGIWLLDNPMLSTLYCGPGAGGMARAGIINKGKSVNTTTEKAKINKNTPRAFQRTRPPNPAQSGNFHAPALSARHVSRKGFPPYGHWRRIRQPLHRRLCQSQTNGRVTRHWQRVLFMLSSVKCNRTAGFGNCWTVKWKSELPSRHVAEPTPHGGYLAAATAAVTPEGRWKCTVNNPMQKIYIYV